MPKAASKLSPQTTPSLVETVPVALKTRERILEGARILFNSYGVETVSTRQIASELHISHGNLCYHFPRKEDIILALYEQLVERMNASIQTTASIPINKKDSSKKQPQSSIKTEMHLRTLVEGISSGFELLNRYKFLMLDFVGVMRKMPKIKEHYATLVALRKKQFSAIRQYCVEQDWMRADMVQELDAFHNEAMFIIGDFWLASAEILYNGDEKKKISNYAKVLESIIIPLLTEEGRKELKKK